jgi:hypothetical protein
MYDDKHILKVVEHATTSALNNQVATVTFLLQKPSAIWNLKVQAPYFPLKRQLKGYCQEWQKICGSPKTQETQLSMQILTTQTMHYTARSLPIMCHKNAF